MEFFADTEAVAQLEAELAQAQADTLLPLPAALALQVALAWQLRQRDTVRSLMLADQVEHQCGVDNLPPQVAQVLLLRLNLIRGEVAWLEGEFESAQTLAQAALNGFGALADAPGMALDAALGTADAHWLLAWIALDQGDEAREGAELTSMETICRNIDPLRHTIAQAMIARNATFIDPASAKAHWSESFITRAASQGLHPAARCWLDDFFGVLAYHNSDHVNCIHHLSQTWVQALASGQIRRAMTAATNIGDAFNRLNDYHTALEWMQRGLLLAREKGWPNSLGLALMESAETLRYLQQYDNAHALLREAQVLMAAMVGSHNYALSQQYLGDVELALKQYPAALANFELLEQRAMALGHADLQSNARRGQAQALLELGQPQAALQVAAAALAGAQSNPDHQMAALRVLAAIHSRHPLPPPSAMQAQSAALHYLQQALALAQGIENYTIPGELFDAIAHEHARLGDFAQAWQLAGRATLAREKIHGIETTNRARAMQAAYQSERMQAEDAHRRELVAEARRAEIMQQMMLQDKMAGLGTLTAGVAHEINNPTNFVHVAAQNQREDIAAFRQYLTSMIEAEDAPDVVQTIDAHFAKLSSGVATMLNGTRRIKAIVKDLRSFTRLDEAEKKAVRLSECITSTLNLVRTSWLEKVEFVTEFIDDPEVECWPALLNQVFMNLLVNGCQAIEEKQRQRNAPDTASVAQRGQMHLRLLQKKQTMMIEIRDDGNGIAPEVQARIMEPFFTTKEVGSGTGLGLSIAFGIVQKHGGTLNFSSTPGLGSCFRIELPLSSEDD